MAWLAFGDTIKITDIAGLGVVFLGVLLTAGAGKGIQKKMFLF